MSEATTPRFRSVLDRFVAYRPGKVVVSPEGRSFKLSSNESPHGPLPSVVEAIGEAARNVNRYPDNNATSLTEAIASFCGVPADHVAVGCGSVGMTQMLLEAVAEPGAEVVYAWRSFEAYPLLVSLSGATSVQVPLRDETHDLRAMADAITENTRVVFVCNPNNPTGTAVGRAEIEAFLDRVPADCLVVLDEAYREYVRDDDVPDGLTLYGDRPNLAILRTFSKAYGLAGLRIGYLVAHPLVAGSIRKTFLPFSVNSVAQAAGIASLDATDELMERVEGTVKERDRVRAALLADGWTVPPTEANFVWLRLGDRTMEFSAACDAHGVSVRPFDGEGARVSIGSPEENDAFLAVAGTFRR
ncbi:histidinol-phosphate transaminase [Actinomadura citrea]|uniref:Aromatic amino acid aminotransferase n=1 Tax=Actinomadura citrea TaxID=46158 RepID=A0A7Y9KBM5_9ACTN|nr:histidinol-phosphate transaminase [Actinomadura citrea]NYE10148.1 histidinol-phosphate aminotransferase [Actinomadura citrea]GGT70404.1 putative phenylalanine aminotransferase [Actinomadura citrea]